MYSNVIGGEGYNPHYEQQIPFSGLTHTESTLKLLGNAQIQVRHKFHEKQYLTLSGNYAIHQNQFSNFLQGKKIYGTSIGYGYDSPLGPIEDLYATPIGLGRVWFIKCYSTISFI